MIERKTVSQCSTSDYCMGWNDAVDAMPKWISVDATLPKEGECVYMWVTSYGEIGWLSDGKWRSEYVNSYEEDEVTHWMPLPDAPKEEA